MAIRSFGDRRTEQIFRIGTAAGMSGELCRKAKVRLDLLHAAGSLYALRFPPGNRLEKLPGYAQNGYSIRVTKQWRIVFLWTDDGAERVQVVDYHD